MSQVLTRGLRHECQLHQTKNAAAYVAAAFFVFKMAKPESGNVEDFDTFFGQLIIDEQVPDAARTVVVTVI